MCETCEPVAQKRRSRPRAVFPRTHRGEILALDVWRLASRALKRKLEAISSRDRMKAIAVIPARLASTRLPRKMLREIGGRPLIGVVYEAVRSSLLLADVIIATDSEEIMAVCRAHGWNAQMTSASHRSGTERVHEISGREAAEVYVNVQGDEPLVRSEQIETLLKVMENVAAEVGTVMTP